MRSGLMCADSFISLRVFWLVARGIGVDLVTREYEYKRGKSSFFWGVLHGFITCSFVCGNNNRPDSVLYYYDTIIFFFHLIINTVSYLTWKFIPRRNTLHINYSNQLNFFINSFCSYSILVYQIHLISVCE